MPIVLPVKNLKNTIAKAKMSMERPSWTIQVVWPEEPLTGLSFSRFFLFFFLILLEFWKVGSIFRIKWQLTVSFGLMDQFPVSHEKARVSCYLLGIFYRVTQ